ncbi:hypothetical protein [Plantactinospora soyae]|uniref:Uncharacterized protein n=1 Tax=Plantactinospora soyae TaxID=1544732 RepID=A0A927QXL2_9ACTN|nr:hypothetical protein [Plantactinospora soyae]MBE1485593.1 hypothetical protein [Plantactinospora soyae]
MDNVWVELAGFVFDAVSGLGAIAALVIAVMAYKVAKRQGKQTFEIEVLRELALMIEKDPKIGMRIVESEPGVPPIAESAGVRLALLPKHELPLWRAVIRGSTDRDPYSPYLTGTRNAAVNSALNRYLGPGWLAEQRTASGTAELITHYLNQEILDAIERRSR